MLTSRKNIFRENIARNYSLSSDGRSIAFLKDLDGQVGLYLSHVDNLDNFVRLTAAKSDNVFAAPYEPIRWVLDDKALIFTRIERGAFVRYIIDIKTRIERLIPPRHSDYSFITALGSINLDGVATHIAVSTNQKSTGYRDFEIIDLSTLERANFIENLYKWNLLLFANGMEPIVYETSTVGGGSDICLFLESANRTLKSLEPDDVWGSKLLGVSSDGQNIYMHSNQGRNTSALISLNIDTRKETVLYKDDKFDAGAPIFNPRTNKPIFIVNHREKTETNVIDDKFEFIDRKIKEYTGANYVIRSMDHEMRTLVVDDLRGKELLFHVSEDSAPKILRAREVYDKLTTQSYWISGADESEILCYLSSADQQIGDKKRPMVVLLNSLWCRDTWHSNPTVQWLVDRGYLILQINFSGSTGFGKKHLQAARQQWGGRVIDDIAVAVRRIQEMGIVKDNLTATMGHSFGGYASFMSIARYPELFSAGIATSLVTNIKKLFDIPAWSTDIEALKFDIGDPKNAKDLQQMNNFSPAYNGNKITRPMYIAVGENDPFSTANDLEKIIGDIQVKNVPISFISFANEYHTIEDKVSREFLLYSQEKFLSEHLFGKYEETLTEDLEGKIASRIGF